MTPRAEAGPVCGVCHAGAFTGSPSTHNILRSVRRGGHRSRGERPRPSNVDGSLRRVEEREGRTDVLSRFPSSLRRALQIVRTGPAVLAGDWLQPTFFFYLVMLVSLAQRETMACVNSPGAPDS